MKLVHLVLVIVGGAAGTCCRYWIGGWFRDQPWDKSFPFGTLLINVVGSFILGFALVTLRNQFPGRIESLQLLLGVGFCGGFTTFSAFTMETYELAANFNIFRAGIYVGASIVAGLLGVILGVGLACLLFPKQS